MNKRTNTAQWEEKYQRWRIAVQKDGVRKQFYSSTPGRTGQREANAKADAWLENDIAVKAGRVENVYQLWIEDLKLTTSTGNWKPVESRWRTWVLPIIGKKKVNTLTDRDLQTIINKAAAAGMIFSKAFTEHVRAGGKLSGSTQQHYHRMLSSVFARAVKWQLLPESPCQHVEAPKATEVDVDVLEEEDVAKLLEALQDAPTQFSVITQLALFTGARRGEICALRWSDINLATGVISIGRTVQYITGQGLVFTAPKTKRSKRCIRVGAACIALLHEYRLTQKAERLKVGSAWARTVQIEGGKVVPNDLLFTKWNGTPLDPNRITSWFPHFLAAHDLPAVHFHSLRHSNASLLIAAHVPITAVSGRLGHAQTSTTLNIYASMIQSADAAAADALEGVFDRIQEKNHA